MSKLGPDDFRSLAKTLNPLLPLHRVRSEGRQVIGYSDEAVLGKFPTFHRRHLPESSHGEDHRLVLPTNGTRPASWRSKRVEEFPSSHVDGLPKCEPQESWRDHRIPAPADLKEIGLHDLREGRRRERQCRDHRTEGEAERRIAL